MKDRKIMQFGDFKNSHKSIDKVKKGTPDKKKTGLRTAAKKGEAGYDTLEDAPNHVGGKVKDQSTVKTDKKHFDVKPPKKRLSTVKVHENENEGMLDQELWDGLTCLVTDGCDGQFAVSGDEEKIKFTLNAFSEEFALDPTTFAGSPVDESKKYSKRKKSDCCGKPMIAGKCLGCNTK